MRAPVPFTALLAAAVFALPSAARGQNPPALPPGAAQAAPRDTSPDSAAAPLAIRPGDVIRIEVWGHPELSGEFPVDENYNLLFPLVGSINVRHVSVTELREQLGANLGQLFQRPFFTLTPLFRVAVLGEVVKPGLYSVDPTLTIYDLLALAGGPTRTANTRRMHLVRGGESIQVTLEPQAIASSTLRELGVHSGDQLVVPAVSVTREDLFLFLQVLNLALLAYTVFRK